MMGKICGFISGLFVLIAGLALLFSGLGSMSATAASTLAGAMLALFGLSFIIHKIDVCPMCQVPEMKRGK